MGPRGTPHGAWPDFLLLEIDDDSFKLDVTVPPNTTATVLVPGEDPQAVVVNGESPGRHAGAKVSRHGLVAIAHEMPSGTMAIPGPASSRFSGPPRSP